MRAEGLRDKDLGDCIIGWAWRKARDTKLEAIQDESNASKTNFDSNRDYARSAEASAAIFSPATALELRVSFDCKEYIVTK